MDTTDANLIAYLVAVLFLDHLSLGEPGMEKAPFTSNILKITLQTLYVSGEESQKQKK
jgi:hypothetical protein